jgi:UDP-N-acetylglucosamine--N-acetylmuramyl-(pentapeptide) pyrophosphoryl-undecaprenol N-acetylglucosamine transferase
MRLLICAGGTGGGVYPALAVLKALEEANERAQLPEDHSALSVLWVGSAGGMEADLVKRLGVPFEAIPAAGVHGVGLKALPGNLLQLGRGVQRSRQILRSFEPDVLFFTGGYVAAPVALAGRRIPKVLYVPDIEPGLALKFLARFADRIAVSAQDSIAFFPSRSRVAVTGYPTRPGLVALSKAEALKVFGLRPELPVLLVIGGSTGARSINRALLQALPDLLEEMQIIHLSGFRDWQEVQAAAEQLKGETVVERYKPYAYLHEELGAALAAADLALARAGASTLGEFPLAGLPAILVPYPYAWRYQKVNAQYLARRGAAQILEDEDLPQRLAPSVRELMADLGKRGQMSTAMRSLAQPNAARAIAELLQAAVRKDAPERM